MAVQTRLALKFVGELLATKYCCYVAPFYHLTCSFHMRAHAMCEILDVLNRHA